MERTAGGASARATRIALLAALLAAAAVGCRGGRVALPELPVGEAPVELLARGEYIVRDVAVCGHCHAADPQADPDGPLSGGYAFRSWRLGTIRASNLTPDSATGLGEWSEAEIVRAVRRGQGRRGGVLAPVMPYHWFNGMSDRDALAMARYLRSVEPVANEVERAPNVVFSLAELLFLSPDAPPTGQAPPRGASAEYGRYLANHVALCADCHTPRRGLMASPDMRRLFAGRSDPPAGFPANPPNLTPDSATGIGRWTEEHFVSTLRTGVNPQGDSLHAFMPWRQYRRMTDGDLRAIYRYLRTLAPLENRVPRRADEG